MLRRVTSTLAMLGVLHLAAPAQACIPVSQAARTWAQCGYKVASETGDHKFMLNFARAKSDGSTLLPTAQPRWSKLERRIVARCGSYARAAAADNKNPGRGYVPDNQFLAISDTSDIEKLVKSNA